MLSNLVCYILAQKCMIGVYRERAMGEMGGKTGEWGEVPLGQLFLMMSPGCMQRRVQFGQRRAEIFAKNSKIKPAPNRYRVTRT